MKLTREQEAMFEACLATGAAWTTSRDGPNMPLLLDLEDRGIMEEVDAPAEFLASYRITDAGRRALAEKGSAG